MVEPAWEYYITDPYNERMDVYYPYFKGDEKSVAFVTISAVFSDKCDAAARLRLEDSKDNTGTAQEETVQTRIRAVVSRQPSGDKPFTIFLWGY